MNRKRQSAPVAFFRHRFPAVKGIRVCTATVAHDDRIGRWPALKKASRAGWLATVAHRLEGSVERFVSVARRAWSYAMCVVFP